MADKNRMNVGDYLRRYGQAASPTSKSKYGNKKVVADGMTFDSKFEAKVYEELKLLKAGGQVEEFECQAEYPFVINGVKVCTYVADFVVNWTDGREEVWDAKGFRTKEYIIKKKLLKALYGIDIVERGIKPRKAKEKKCKGNLLI